MPHDHEDSVQREGHSDTDLKPEGQTSLPGLPPATNATTEAARSALGEGIPVLNKHGKPRGKPGRPIKSGKWAKSNVPVGTMGNRSVPLLVEEEGGEAPIPIDFGNAEAVFDKEANRPYVEGIIELLELLNGELNGWRMFRATKNREVANLVAEELKMKPVPKKIMENGGVDWAEQIRIDLSKTPQGAVIGGFILWQFQNLRGLKEAIARYHKENPI